MRSRRWRSLRCCRHLPRARHMVSAAMIARMMMARAIISLAATTGSFLSEERRPGCLPPNASRQQRRLNAAAKHNAGGTAGFRPRGGGQVRGSLHLVRRRDLSGLACVASSHRHGRLDVRFQSLRLRLVGIGVFEHLGGYRFVRVRGQLSKVFGQAPKCRSVTHAHKSLFVPRRSLLFRNNLAVTSHYPPLPASLARFVRHPT